MARVATELKTWDVDLDNLPAGLEIANTVRTLGTRPKQNKDESDDDYKARIAADPNYKPNAVVRVFRVAETSEGVANAIRFLSEHGPQDEDGPGYGIILAANALNDAFMNHFNKLDPKDADDALSFVPPVTRPRYVDPFEAATERIARLSREAGRMLTIEEYGFVVQANGDPFSDPEGFEAWKAEQS